MDVAAIRRDFPILEDERIIYFDNAATSQRPRQVLEAVDAFYRKSNANPLRGLYQWSIEATEAYETAREKVAAFIGAGDASEIIFTRNTTESVNLAAYSWGLTNIKEGDKIVISVMEHHSNILPWQMVARQKGAELVYMEPDEEGVLSGQEIAKIDEKTALVAIGMVSNVLGVRNPVEAIIKRAHEMGALVLVDGAQATPHQGVDVTALDADFFAFSAHKMLGPFGIGVLYGKKKLLEDMPPFLTGGEMIEYVTREDATYAELPHKFEAGTVNAAAAVGLGAAIDYLGQIGFDAIRKQEDLLCSLLYEGMKNDPHITLYGPTDPARRNGIVTFNIEGCHPHDVSSVLDSEQVCIRAGHHCAQPLMQYLKVNSTVRASLYFYNTENEVERFLKSLTKVRGWLGYED
ncbi:MAG: SufS family cysteine desulfurase, partial [Lachnospiraceae bacterium]|nr:SufS family cysteine desulfurase [Lachnospiraceae bacterium]